MMIAKDQTPPVHYCLWGLSQPHWPSSTIVFTFIITKPAPPAEGLNFCRFMYLRTRQRRLRLRLPLVHLILEVNSNIECKRSAVPGFVKSELCRNMMTMFKFSGTYPNEKSIVGMSSAISFIFAIFMTAYMWQVMIVGCQLVVEVRALFKHSKPVDKTEQLAPYCLILSVGSILNRTYRKYEAVSIKKPLVRSAG